MSSEIKWSFKRAWTLMKCWYLPVQTSPANTLSNDGAMAVRALALLIIVTLTFAIRYDGIDSYTGKASYAMYTIGLSSVLALSYEFLSSEVNISIKNSNIITWYGFLILNMFFYLVFTHFGHNSINYVMMEKLAGKFTLYNYILTPIFSSLISVWILFILKIRVFDRVKLTASILKRAFLQSSFAALLTIVIILLSNNLFDFALSKID